MKWVTRERPQIDRIACPWLILRFVDKDAGVRVVLEADQVCCPIVVNHQASMHRCARLTEFFGLPYRMVGALLLAVLMGVGAESVDACEQADR